MSMCDIFLDEWKSAAFWTIILLYVVSFYLSFREKEWEKNRKKKKKNQNQFL